MNNIFEQFDEKLGADFAEKVKEAADNNYEEVPAGNYIARIEKMEIGATKDNRPMFKVQMRLVEGEGESENKYLAKFKKKKPCIFMNRVMFGTKNDASMIASVVGWINSLELEHKIAFSSFSQFANDILDAYEDSFSLEFGIDYNPSAFNSISILEAFEA